MAVNPQRRQRKLAKQRAKKKAEQRLHLRRQSQSVSSKFHQNQFGTVVYCSVSESIWQTGMGYAFIGRSTKSPLVAYASFLVDMHCMGVKDCFGNLASPYEVQNLWDRYSDKMEPTPFSLACARKLIEGAVAFAAEAKIAPHPDYQYLKLIFADADTSACPREFTYGHDGKPFFTRGPNDSMERCREIIEKLTERYGPDGFHFIIGSQESLIEHYDEDQYEFEDDDEDYLESNDQPLINDDFGLRY